MRVAYALSGGTLPIYDRALAVTETDPALTDLGLLLQVNKAIALFNLDRCEEGLRTAERAQQFISVGRHEEIGAVLARHQ